jgi:translation initiation factor IF-3
MKDEGIKAYEIQIVDESGVIQPPIRLRDALKSFNRNENFLVQVAAETWDKAAVCKILSKKYLREQEHLRAKAARALAVNATVKQIELNWAIDPHDLSHRLKQMSNFLEKGRKVEILMTPKKGKRRATIEEAKNLMQTVKQRVQETGAGETKAMEGALLQQVTMYVQKKFTK